MSEFSIMARRAFVARRAELLVEEFLNDLGPSRLVKAESAKLDFDFVVAFKKPDGGLKYCAVEVKQTEKPIAGDFHFMTGRRFVEASKSNMPTVVIIADTKHNELYYGFASQANVVNAAHRAGFFEVAVPAKKTGSSPAEKRQFIQDVLASN
jgi:hypothetical protein